VWWVCVKLLSVIQLICAVKYLSGWVRVRSDLAVKKQERSRESERWEEGKDHHGGKNGSLARVWNVFISLCRF
jgi:hypothetical protein